MLMRETPFAPSWWILLLWIFLCSRAISSEGDSLFPVQLNDTLVSPGAVGTNGFSPDGNWICYAADQDRDDVFELYSVPVVGGAVVKLNRELTGGEDVKGFKISDDNRHVVYLVDLAESTSQMYLYSVPIGGGESVRLNPLLEGPQGGVATDFQISADSSRVFYRASHAPSFFMGFYSVPIGGGAAVRIDGNHPSGGISYFKLSQDGQRWFYWAGDALYTVPIGGGEPVFLSSGNPSRGVFLTPDDSHVAFSLGRNFWSVPIAGGDPILLTPNNPPDQFAGLAKIAPDGGRFTYGIRIDGVIGYDLYSIPVGGGNPTPLSVPGAGGVVSHEITTDSSRVIYSYRDGAEYHLFSVPIGGGAPLRLGLGLFSNGFRIAGSHVVFLASQEPGGPTELYRVPVSGGAVSRMNGPLSGSDEVFIFQCSPDLQTVLYATGTGFTESTGLYSVPITGGIPVKLNGAIGSPVHLGGVWSFNEDSSLVLYTWANGLSGRELFLVSIAGGPTRKVNSPLVAGGRDRFDYKLSPDGKWVVYRVDSDTVGIFELYCVSVDGGPEIKLNGPLEGDDGVEEFWITPDSLRVLYSDPNGLLSLALHSVPIAGGDPIQLNGSLNKASRLRDPVEFSPDSNWVIYRAHPDVILEFELYRSPVAGGASVKLNAPLVSGGDVVAFKFASNETVIYRADQETDQLIELYSVPIEGGVATKLSNSVSGGGVQDFLIVPDGTRILYRADQNGDGILQVLSIALGGGAAVDLEARLTATNFFENEIHVTPDSTRAVYWTDTLQDGQYDLCSILVGGGESVKLGGPLTPFTRRIREFNYSRVSPNSQSVVFVSDQEGNGDYGLFSVPITGGPNIKLSGSASLRSGDFGVFRISPDSSRIVYRSQDVLEDVIELNSVPIDGGDSVKLNPPLLSGGEVSEHYAFSHDSMAVTFGVVDDPGGGNALYSVPVSGGPAMIVDGRPAFDKLTTLRISPIRDVIVYTAAFSPDHIYSLYSTLPQAVWESPSGIWSDPTNWRWGNAPSAMFESVILNQGEVQVLPDIAASSGSLRLGGGEGIATLRLSRRASMVIARDAAIRENAVLSLEWDGTNQVAVMVGTNISLGGELRVEFSNGFQPVGDESFNVWQSISVTGAFDSVLLAALPAGLIWERGQLNSNGALRVAGIVPQSYAQFSAVHNLVGGPEEDDDADERVNLFEYLNGTNPLQIEGTEPLLRVTRLDGESCLSFAMAQNVASDVLLEIESSSSLQEGGLGGWSVVASRSGAAKWTGSASVYVTPEMGGLNRVLIKPLLQSTPEQFYRLRVTLIPE